MEKESERKERGKEGEREREREREGGERERGKAMVHIFTTVLSLASSVAGPEGFILNLQVLYLEPLLPL